MKVHSVHQLAGDMNISLLTRPLDFVKCPITSKVVAKNAPDAHAGWQTTPFYGYGLYQHMAN